jgi:crotonobetainyl-CoA:carnitine CoA-transferase CaiB-like acyl-CoA transferase
MRKILPLQGRRILSLSLNLPGPAALLRCKAMGARCVKVEPPQGDPMQHYRAEAYAEMHQGIRVLAVDLKQPAGQQRLQRELAQADVLLTSFRPSALAKLGLDWAALHKRHPQLCQVAIVGAAGERAEEPGHDLTYQAEHDLVTGLELPASLFADMGGALMVSEAVLQALLQRERKGQGVFMEVALADAAAWLALPRRWGLTQPTGAVGGAHAGYRVYACKDGRVAVAALEPHFAAALCQAAGVPGSNVRSMMAPATQRAMAAFFLTQTRRQLERLAVSRDIPLHTLPKS